jgi:hypothetical protein
MIINNKEKNFIIPINEIACWPKGEKSTEGVLGEVPVLQRGLVWDQAQIELLWDSILRGIPIGSIVLSEITDSIKDQKKGKELKLSDATHFILDGQQRCNAITMGFNELPKEGSFDSIIWFDLNTNYLNTNSTREFLIRLTTLAHPWGFNKSDEAGRLGVGRIREKMKEIMKGEEIDFAEMKKPLPRELFPFEANFPVPISILLNAEDNNFWNNVKLELTKLNNAGFGWAKNAIEYIEGDNINKNKIQQAISLAKETEVVALNVPIKLLESERNNENNDENIHKDGITNIEHLFQRLNRQGTNLDGEELVYSMMKSHIPRIANTIDEVSQSKMPSSKLLQQSIRVALSDDKGLKGKFNISQIRKISTSKDYSGEKELIESFINNNLKESASIADNWLSINDNQPWGLPPVLKTSIAINSSDVYCLLLYLAYKHPKLNMNSYKKIVGLALFIHWFVDDKHKVVNELYLKIQKIKAETTEFDIYPIVKEGEKVQEYLKRLQAAELLKVIIDIKKDNPESWDWNSCKEKFVSEKPEKSESYYVNYVNPCLQKIKDQRELLLYAQRAYICERFKDYDPARKDLWKGINRPWDYDHILPSSYFYNIKRQNDIEFLELVKKFGYTNGNLRAWPFEDNRSDQDYETAKKMKNEKYWHNSFIDEIEKIGYSNSLVVNDKQMALDFAHSCKSRLIRIYSEWFDNFNIEELIIRVN